MDSSTRQTQTSNLENKSSLTSRKIWDLEQKKDVIIDAPSVKDIDFRIVNQYPEGQIITVRDSDGALTDIRMSQGKIFKTSSTYSEV